MLQRELQKHQWKAFSRHPMYERNMAIKIFMFIVFGIMGIQLLSFGFFLNTMLLKIGSYTHAIYTFNAFLPYIFMGDFMIKYMWKQNQSMEIAPYLTLPIRRKKLFNFLQVKEFSNIWNLYPLFLLVPFAFQSITPYFGFLSAVLYILFFYLLCIGNSLLVSLANHLLKRNGWFFFLPPILIAAIAGLSFLPGIPLDEFAVKTGEWVLHNNPFVWLAGISFLALLWRLNQKMMREGVYRALQGNKSSDSVTFSRVSLLDRLGETGEFIQLEIKMILRSKRLKQQMYGVAFIFVYFIVMLYSSSSPINSLFFSLLFFSMFTLGGLGLVMTQYLFTAESSFFDGLMARERSLLQVLKGKYLLYSGYSLVVMLLMMIPVLQGKLDFLFITSTFFYTIGFLFFLMFQNAVYNKSYFDLSEGGAFNWKGTSGNMLLVTMIGMFIPTFLVLIIDALFSRTVACGFMLITGLSFTLTVNYWLKWTYNRFLRRRYKNMEGFRSNA
jgi:hypothetical protein